MEKHYPANRLTNLVWKRAVSTVNGVLGEAVGQMYVEKYFPAAAKKKNVWCSW